MFDEALLNKQYMPYVSRAKAYGGPKLLQAVGPALLTKNWRQNSLELLDALTARFGSDVAKVAAQKAVLAFGLHHELNGIIHTRFEEIYEQTART